MSPGITWDHLGPGPGLSLAAVVRAKVHLSFVLLARHESVESVGAVVELCKEYNSTNLNIFSLVHWALLDLLFKSACVCQPEN